MSIKKAVVSSSFWTGGGNLFRQVIQLLTIIMLSRLLSPSDFGAYAILAIFVGFLNVFASLGVSQAIIHLDSVSQEFLSSAFILNIAMGASLSLSLFFLSSFLATFFDDEILIGLFRYISVSFFIASFSMVQRTLLEKKLQFKKVILVEQISFLLSSSVSVVYATYGGGVYSLVLMSLSNSLFLAIGFWFVSTWRPSLFFSKNEIKPIIKYSAHLTGFTFINYFARNADNLIIGKFLDSFSLGIYSLAYKILLYPLENISRVLVRVLFPAFALIKDDKLRFRKHYLEAISIIGFLTFPIMLGLASVAERFVAVVFGDKWLGLDNLLLVMAPIGMIQSIVTTVGAIYTAIGATDKMFKIGFLNSVVTVISFVVGVEFGVMGVATCYCLANLITLYHNLNEAWTLIDLPVKEGLFTLSRSFTIASIMALSVLGLDFLLANLSVRGDLLILVLQILVGVILYSLISYKFNKPIINKFFKLAKKSNPVDTE